MKKISIVLLVIAAIMAVTAYLNRGDIVAKTELQEDEIVIVKSEDKEVKRMDFTLIKELEAMEFPATLKSSGKDPVELTYKGVEVRRLLEKLGLTVEGKKQLIAKAVDGYTVALSVEEVMAEDNVYLVYEREGEPLGKKEDGGSGPYQIVIREDAFGQRWVKFLMELEIK